MATEIMWPRCKFGINAKITFKIPDDVTPSNKTNMKYTIPSGIANIKKYSIFFSNIITHNQNTHQ